MNILLARRPLYLQALADQIEGKDGGFADYGGGAAGDGVGGVGGDERVVHQGVPAEFVHAEEDGPGRGLEERETGRGGGRRGGDGHVRYYLRHGGIHTAEETFDALVLVDIVH